ncbi:aminotransferase-like domain-containing protein [Allokutzneria oryzae]|uniref:PLP-dependent aminotransferase family protein n=1 Tax=Allokutzneria oryzae TaxID=1378989 RepID=A0ABV5ZTX2_9PSEU
MILGDLHGRPGDASPEPTAFLDEVAARYPDAVSFASGRPAERHFDLDAVHRYLRRFERYLADERGYTDEEIRRTLCQYGRVKGVMHELVARHLWQDVRVEADPEAVVVTAGCQEAIFLVLRALRADDRDVALAVSPTHAGFTGAARLVDMPVLPVAAGTAGVDLDELAAQVRAARRDGLRPRVCHVMPDFANPSGASMDLATRQALLDLAEREDILLLEDDPYGLFHSGGTKAPALKALDTRARVVYLGSFSATVLPGARVGYVLADQPVAGGSFADRLAEIKSMVTVNTSPIAQAVVGGKLLEHGCSLELATTGERQTYQRNLYQLVDGLHARFADDPDITWNTPAGGFFLVMTVPFEVDDELLEYSAREHGVLWTPMRHFYGDGGGNRQLRLSFSGVDSRGIEIGLDRLAAFLTDPAVRLGRPASLLPG